MDDKEIEAFVRRISWFGREPEFPLEPCPMYERFTDRARKVMQLANQECDRLNHEYVGTEHILLGLVKEGSGVASNVLRNLNMDLGTIRDEVMKIVQPGPEEVDIPLKSLAKKPITPRGKQALEWAIQEAKNLQHNYVGTEHLLLGVLHVEEGIAAQIILNLGQTLESVKQGVLDLLGSPVKTEEAVRHALAAWKTTVPVTNTDRHKLAEVERIVNFVTDPAEAVKEIKKLFGK